MLKSMNFVQLSHDKDLHQEGLTCIERAERSGTFWEPTKCPIASLERSSPLNGHNEYAPRCTENTLDDLSSLHFKNKTKKLLSNGVFSHANKYRSIQTRRAQIKMSLNKALILLVFFLASAAPTSAADCTITSFSQVQDVVSNCTNIVIEDLTVPGGVSLELDLQTGSTLTFHGKIVFEVSNWAGPLVSIKGTQLTVRGETGHVLNGQGERYWDGLGGSGSAKPSFFSISYVENSTFTGINILNCPINCVSVVSSNDVVLDGFTVDVSEGREKGVNTDGFGVTYCADVVIRNSVVKNQDDCVVVNQGDNYTFHNLVCEGGHGLSFSVGFGNISISQNTVTNVTFKDCVVLNSANGIHVKTHPNAGQGSITDVLYSNITLQGINNYGISIEQNYPGHGEEPRGNILIKNLTMDSVTGSMAGTNSMAVEIICGDGGCEDWHWHNVDITGASNNDTCNYEPEGYTC